MAYTKPQNTVHLRDRLASLDIFAQLANESDGNDALRDSILAKIKKRREAEKARYSETDLPNGSVRIRHPGIGVVTVAHDVLAEPVQMFGNKTKSLTAYTLTVSRADAIVTPEGLLSYEPYEVVAGFKLSELSYNQMVANPGSGAFPVEIQKIQGLNIEPTIESAFVGEARGLAMGVEKAVDKMSLDLADMIKVFEDFHAKGGKLTQKVIAEVVRSEIPSTWNYSDYLSYQISRVAEFSQGVATCQRIEIEALIGLKQARGE